ncbi:hypothetical protein ASPVEDRAFT_653232 [Aspergillus versicolor CBS 583.65]|uniref:Uncharacterized protein n=1 Tax=Aspergillus versicolor CBS 583.65 TaxID=1036611 RepID=A0A1L9PK71_ASPVE|nr:uncharacterized protein ASPVEDRAFT_653232 [Aspergillus versicolor CBS 583.65]OJJ01930.1 hypothetical protein ASPVEDRAFT_653232 [Aspergillus versicolor CBS 583.65]
MSSEEPHLLTFTDVTDPEELQENADLCAAMASAAQIMDNVGVLNVLSGWPAVSILCDVRLIPVCNIPPRLNRVVGANLEFFKEMIFLVPDDQVQQAIDALAANPGYPRCVDPSCAVFKEDRCPNEPPSDDPVRFGVVGAAHFHVVPSGLPLTLYPMSKMVWSLRDLNDESPHITLASACMPEPWAELYPIRVLTRRAFVESLILCRCRDYGRNPSLDTLWCRLLLAFAVRGVDLSDGFAPFWSVFAYLDDVYDPDELLCELRDKLITRDGLPVHPDHCPDSWKFRSRGHWRRACTEML